MSRVLVDIEADPAQNSQIWGPFIYVRGRSHMIKDPPSMLRDPSQKFRNFIEYNLHQCYVINMAIEI